MLTPSISGDIRPASTAAVSGRWFSAAAWPSYSIVDLADRAFPRLGQLAGERAQQAAQFQVGLQPRRILGRDRGHVDRVR